MLKNYIKVALRNLFKNRLFSTINIGGLAIGMAVAIVISLWIWDEVTFNQYHNSYDRIAEVMQNHKHNGELVSGNFQPIGLASAIREDYGDNFEYVVMSSWEEQRTFSVGDKKLSVEGRFMESDAPNLLSLKMKSGDRTGIKDPTSILISASTARAFFGENDAIQQSVQLGNEEVVTIAGVYEDLPDNSAFANLNFLAPWKLYERELPNWLGWGNNWFQVLVQLADNSNISQVSTTIEEVYNDNLGERAEEFNTKLFLHPMSKWHLYSEFENGISVSGRIKFIWFFGIIGVIVLLLACINFMNLSTARSEKRAKEVGIRKAIGSSRNQLIGQFFSESVVLSLFAFALAVGLVYLLLPFFNGVADKDMKILWSSPIFWLLGIGFSVFTGLLAGIYPALYLSSFKAVRALKGTFKVGRLASVPRKTLVVLQFTVSVALIVATIVIFQQIQHAKNRSIGYDQSRLLEIRVSNSQINQHFEAIQNELLQSNTIESLAMAQSTITQNSMGNNGFTWEGKPEGLNERFNSINITHDFGKTINWEIVEGRDFSRDFSTDSTSFIINQQMADYINFEEPIGKIMDWGNNGKFKIIGVIKNIITNSPYDDIEPRFYMLDWGISQNLMVKINSTANLSATLATIKNVYQKYDPINPFEYEFVDQRYAEKFGEEERIGKLAGFFAALAIFISCMGLFAMISFVAEQRAKEIGIRKVLGATVANIVGLLSKEFLILVLVALVIATPLAWYMMNHWLKDFTYRVDIQWWVFALAGGAAISIALLTVSFQSVKAALANPIKSLRNE